MQPSQAKRTWTPENRQVILTFASTPNWLEERTPRWPKNRSSVQNTCLVDARVGHQRDTRGTNVDSQNQEPAFSGTTRPIQKKTRALVRSRLDQNPAECRRLLAVLERLQCVGLSFLYGNQKKTWISFGSPFKTGKKPPINVVPSKNKKQNGHPRRSPLSTSLSQVESSLTEARARAAASCSSPWPEAEVHQNRPVCIRAFILKKEVFMIHIHTYTYRERERV